MRSEKSIAGSFAAKCAASEADFAEMLLMAFFKASPMADDRLSAVGDVFL